MDRLRYFNSDQLSDVVLVCGGERFAAHRIVLASRCIYFRSMFESGMREATQEEVELHDVEVEVFRKLLEHLYTDTDIVPSEIALELFSAADRFGVERLRQLCAARVEADMSVNSVCNILTVADQHNATYLKEECVQFIVARFSEVHSTDGFRELDRGLLDLVHTAISARLFPSKGMGA